MRCKELRCHNIENNVIWRYYHGIGDVGTGLCVFYCKECDRIITDLLIPNYIPQEQYIRYTDNSIKSKKKG